MKQSTRAYLYRLSTAVVPVLVSYGMLSDEKAAVWVGLAGAVFSTGLAAVNTSTKES